MTQLVDPNRERLQQEPAGPSVLVVGAGVTGLMVAASLPEYGHRIALVDKGRSAGGRLATRRVGDLRADHGAQFFTARSPEFRAWVERWQDEGLVYVWSHGWSDGSLAESPHDGHPRYAVREGMNALAKRLAADISARGAAVHTNVKLQAISMTERGWWGFSDDGRVYKGDALVLTCPVPQALTLLREGGVTLAPKDLAALQAITYAPCLCLMIEVRGTPRLPTPGAIQNRGATAAWIADNRRKGISAHAPTQAAPDAPSREQTVVTLHASPEFSTSHYDRNDGEVIAALEPEFSPFLEGCSVDAVQVKRWRYALPTTIHPKRYLKASTAEGPTDGLEDLPPLYFAGDAFGGPRVEGAALSGMAVAAALRELLG